jgi:hypothetical protein
LGGVNEGSTNTSPGLPAYLPRPAGIPVAPFVMQKVLTKAIRAHRKNKGGRLHTQVKGPEKVGGRVAGRTGGGARK